MKIKRLLLLAVLIAFSITCIYMMNDSYDRLARYQYEITAEQRKIMESHFSDDDINYIIQQKIKPEQFMDFILLNNFTVKNTLYYEVCRMIRPTDLQYIVDFVNQYKENIQFVDLESIISNYDYTTLSEFYNHAYTYVKDTKLLAYPDEIDAYIGEQETVYKYVPSNLAIIDNSVMPIASVLEKEYIEIKSEVVEPLKQLCADIAKTNNKTCGGLILTNGYVSYNDQISLYEQAIVKYGYDNFKKYEDYPGQSERQLGYTLSFTASEMAEADMATSEQAKWLSDNAQKYGFIIRYPKEEENKTGKLYQPFTLRYVGVDALKSSSNILDSIFKGN